MRLRKYQQRALDSVFKYFYTKQQGNPLVVLPTGAGKSVVIAEFIKQVFYRWPNQRVIMLTHVKELIQQNANALKSLYPEADIGIYSAGLGLKECDKSVTVAGIQSIYKKAEDVGFKDLIIIDECHLLSPSSNTMYQKFITDIKQINPAVRIIGFTATPFRTKGGVLTSQENNIFTDICVDVSVKELIKQGYLSELISKSGVTQAELGSVKLVGGEFHKKQMEQAFNKKDLTNHAILEMLKFAGDRKQWVVFCSGVEHAQNVSDALNLQGIDSACITGKTPSEDRARILNDFKEGKVKCITNCDVLTTGFDSPKIDLIVFLRATKSPGLYIQMLGRGMRKHPDKENCLVLDFAGNIERFGPIDLIKVGPQGKKSDIIVTPMKACENPDCCAPNFVAARECVECGHPFKIDTSVKHDVIASNGALISGQFVKPERLTVSDIKYSSHKKRLGQRSLKVTYRCGLIIQKEWVCLEHTGYALRKAHIWWERMAGTKPPKSIDEALDRTNELKKPLSIIVQQKGKYTEIASYEFT